MSTDIPPSTEVYFDLKIDNYVSSISRIREKVRDRDKSSHGRPILPSETDLSPQHIDVGLREGGLDKGTMIIRRFDLGLVGYRDPEGNFIDVADFHLYDGSKLVVSGLEGFPVGWSAFVKAGNILANKENEDVGTALVVLCVVVCEAVKLEILCKLFDITFKSGVDLRLCPWMLKLMIYWKELSKELLAPDMHYETDDYCDFYLPLLESEWHDDDRWMIGVSCQDAAKCVGILYAGSPPGDIILHDRVSGGSRIEILLVSVFINGRRSGKIFGTITVDDGFGIQNIYNVDKDDGEPVESCDTLSLVGPERDVVFIRQVHMELDLRDCNDGSQVSKGLVFIGNFNSDSFIDVRRSALVRGENGYAIVYYNIIGEAVVAVVTATLSVKKGDGNEASYVEDTNACVCGSIVAQYGVYKYVFEFQEKYNQTILFRKPISSKSSGCALRRCTTGEKVGIGGSIKLSRSVVAVPVNSSLIIKADLKTSEDRTIVSGSQSWSPWALDETKDITTDHSAGSHVLRVSVTWKQRI